MGARVETNGGPSGILQAHDTCQPSLASYSACIFACPCSSTAITLLVCITRKTAAVCWLTSIQNKSFCMVFVFGQRVWSEDWILNNANCKLQMSSSVQYGSSSQSPVLLVPMDNRPPFPFSPPPPKLFPHVHVATLPEMYLCAYSCRPGQFPASCIQPDWLFGSRPNTIKCVVCHT